MRSRLAHRHTALKFRDSRVQRKGRWTRPLNPVGANRVVIERVRPRYEYAHAVTADEVFSFVHQLPEWPRLAVELERIVLDEGSYWGNEFGYFWFREIVLRSLPADLQLTFHRKERLRDQRFLEGLTDDVETVSEFDTETGKYLETRVVYQLTRETARGFLLAWVLAREVGGYLYSMQNGWRGRREVGEVARRYQMENGGRYWETYVRIFGEPRRRPRGKKIVFTRLA